MGCPVEPDKYQQAWHAQSSQRRVSVDADLLRKEVQRNQRNFRAVIFSRDRRELIVALLLICVWFCLGFTIPLPWTWWLTVPVLVWMAGFMLVYRKRHQPKPSAPDEPLLYCVKNSLADVEAQIWLLRNIFWWYLLPPFLSISAFFVDVGWRVRALGWLPSFGFSGLLMAMVAVLYAGLYFVNQYAVDSQLEPRRRELLALFASLTDEATSEVSGGYPILMGAERVAPSRWRMVLCFVAGLVLLVAGIFLVPVFMHLSSPGTNIRGNLPSPQCNGRNRNRKSRWATSGLSLCRWTESLPPRSSLSAGGPMGRSGRWDSKRTSSSCSAPWDIRPRTRSHWLFNR